MFEVLFGSISYNLFKFSVSGKEHYFNLSLKVSMSINSFL